MVASHWLGKFAIASILRRSPFKRSSFHCTFSPSADTHTRTQEKEEEKGAGGRGRTVKKEHQWGDGKNVSFSGKLVVA